MSRPTSAGVLRIALAQCNPLDGDIRGNTAKIIALAQEARQRLNAGMVVFPELVLTGYPPEDLLLRCSFLDQAEAALIQLAQELPSIPVIVGAPYRDAEGLRNGALWFERGEIRARYAKQYLPNYSVFDEKRYFIPGQTPCVVDFGGHRIGLQICEDLWYPAPARAAQEAGAELLLGLNASPFHLGQYERRLVVLRERIRETGLPIVYVNQVGGQDELVFDGVSLALDGAGQLLTRAPAFMEDLRLVDPFAAVQPCSLARYPEAEEAIYRALVLGVHDYVHKNGFPGVVLGLSGGVDSALTLTIAVDALGADDVLAVLMPSRYTAAMSLEDARAQCETLGVRYFEFSIELPFKAFLEVLAPVLGGAAPDVTEENLQARCRGMLLMGVSNKTGRMVLTTGNKSEMAVGYATLYGDMAGGFAPLKDALKTWVYRLAHWRNTPIRVIPKRVLERPPSAELAPEQKDSDSLPRYDLLDPILERFVERDWSVDEIIAGGFPRPVVEQVVRMVLHNEYKRRQAPPGVRISARAFGRDRRYPITSGYHCGGSRMLRRLASCQD